MNTKTDFTDIKALVFDYGGTLDTHARHWAHVLWDGFREAGIPVDKERFREAYVHGERTLARTPIVLPEDDFHALLLKKINIETLFLVETGAWKTDEQTRRAKVEAAADFCYNYARRTVTTNLALLRRLGKRFPMVLVSNFYGNIGTILRDFGLDACFGKVIESAVVGVRKPDPAIFRLGVEATGCKAGETLVIGDSYDKDVLPAREAGCRTVWFKGEGWTEGRPEDETVPDAVITQLDELLRMLPLT